MSRAGVRSSSARSGFTLVEVLATLVLIGIVLPVAMRGLTVALQATANSRNRVEAAQLASAKINELLVGRDVAAFNASGDFGEEWPEYRWDSTGQAGEWNLYTVTVNVHWTERGQDRSLPLTTWIYPDFTSGGGT